MAGRCARRDGLSASGRQAAVGPKRFKPAAAEPGNAGGAAPPPAITLLSTRIEAPETHQLSLGVGRVLGPQQVLDIEGFRKSQSEVAAFRFAAPGRAYAANTEAPDAKSRLQAKQQYTAEPSPKIRPLRNGYKAPLKRS